MFRNSTQHHEPSKGKFSRALVGLSLFAGLAVFGAPPAISAGQSGDVSNNNTVRTIAGTGEAGNGSDGLLGTDTAISRPFDVEVTDGDLTYFTDTDNHQIRVVDANGITRIIAGTGTAGSGGDGGLATDAQLNNPKGIAVAGNGAVYIADSGNHKIRRINANGNIVTIAGTGSAGYSGDGGAPTSAKLSQPHEVLLAPGGLIYIADTGNSRIRLIEDGTISTIAGTGTQGAAGDGGQATSAQINQPRDIARGPAGALYIADTKNHKVRKIDTNGVIWTVAGTGAKGYYTPQDGGPADQAMLNQPASVAVNGVDNFYIADMTNNRIRRVNPEGIITTITGRGSNVDDGGPAAGLDIDHPRGLAIDRQASLVFADSGHEKIRSILQPDAGDPWIEVATPQNWVSVKVDEEVVASFTCLDDYSGVETCRAEIDGTPVNTGAIFDTSSPGDKLLVVTAIDFAGNVAVETRFVHVRDSRELTGPYAGSSGNTAAVARMYVAIMRRQPEPPGHTFWMSQLDNGDALKEVAAFFITSPEFQIIYGEASDEDFVDLLYSNVMKRGGDNTGRDFWLDLLKSGMPRLDMTFFFTQSPEFRAATGTS